MARKPLKINDSAWLFAETHRTPMQVGMLATFSVPEDRPDFVADLVARWREARSFAPPFNYLFRQLPFPSWAELPDHEIDLDYHLRHSALPSPGSQRELGVLVSRLHSTMMDRRYPLWECHVIEGLEEDRWALYVKAHHSQVDGVGGIRLLKRMLSVDPDARDLLPPWAIGTRGPTSPAPGCSGPPRRLRTTRSRRRTTPWPTGALGRSTWFVPRWRPPPASWRAPASRRHASRRRSRAPTPSRSRAWARGTARPFPSGPRARSSTAGSTPRAGSRPSTTPSTT